MRVLLDECVPRRLAREIAGHDVATVVEMGWSGVKNGQLLSLAAAQFDCFLTVDANLQFQQSAQDLPVSVLVLRAKSNQFTALQPLVSDVLNALRELKPKTLITLGA